jgi:hypothetical protein
VSRLCEGSDDAHARRSANSELSLRDTHARNVEQSVPFKTTTFDLRVPHRVHVSVFAWLLKTKLQASTNGLSVGMIISMYSEASQHAIYSAARQILNQVVHEITTAIMTVDTQCCNMGGTLAPLNLLKPGELELYTPAALTSPIPNTVHTVYSCFI